MTAVDFEAAKRRAHARMAGDEDPEQAADPPEDATVGPPPTPHDTQADTLLDLSHDGLALAMGRLWQPCARHVAPWGKWLFWARAIWQADDHLAHMTRGRSYLRARANALVRDAKAGKLVWEDANPREAVKRAEAIAKSLRSAPMVANVTSLARSNPDLVATVEQWNADPLAIGRPNRRTSS